MKTSILLASLLAALGLTACDRPTVVNTPPAAPVAVPVPVPGPAGPQGETGKTGKPGDAAVILVPQPAASEPK